MEKEQKKRIDVMVDIETMSTDREKGLILSVGVVPFSLKKGEEMEDPNVIHPYEQHISIADSLLYGRVIDDSTQRWWASKTDEAKNVMVNGQFMADKFEFAFKMINNYLSTINENYDLYVWSKGIDFDFPMIESSWKEIDITETPYKFWKKRDMRTIIDAAKVLGWQNEQKSEDIKHTAIADCEDQIKVLKSAFDWIAAGRI